MDTLNKLPDEKFYLIQNKLVHWMQIKGFVRWKQIQKTCSELLLAYSQDYVSQYGNFPEYKLFMPLLRKGMCEIAHINKRAGFVCFSESEYLQNTVSPLLLLNNFPAISKLIKNFKIENSVKLNVKCDLNDSYSYKYCDSKVSEVGIYKAEDKVYSPAFLFDGKEKRIIPGYEENIDSISIARCYVRSMEDKKMFFYHKKRQVLNTNVYSDLPILITRALFLLNKENFNDSDFNYPISYKKDYKNIDDKVINEIMRIFGKNTVEVLDD